MMEQQKEYEGALVTAGVTGTLALVIGIFRAVINERHGGPRGLIRGILASIVVAVLVGWALTGFDLQLPVKLAIVGVCAYLADDILLGLVVIGSLFRDDPGSFIFKLFDALRGRPPSKDSPPPKGKE